MLLGIMILEGILVLHELAGTVETGQRKSASIGGAGLVARVESMIVPLT